jgi:TatA/E family protein of Tat protein translocase
MPTLPEVLLILFIMLVVFGANRLPRIGDALGGAVKRVLRRGTKRSEDESRPES